MAGNASRDLSTRDLKELETFSNLIISRQDEINDYGRSVEEMGSIGHWWDAKVPDSERGFFNWVSLGTQTEKTSMSRKIQKYKDFYQELVEAADALRKAAREGNADAGEILSLYEKLTEMLEQAEKGKSTTNSSTLYKIHKDFIERKEPLENTIKRVECVALRQELRQVSKCWKEAKEEINELRKETQRIYEANSEMQQRLDEITATNEQMAEAQRDLMRWNETMARNQQILMQQNESMVRMLTDVYRRNNDDDS